MNTADQRSKPSKFSNSSFFSQVELHHNDRLVFGSTQLWVFQNPKESGIGKLFSMIKSAKIEEIAVKKIRGSLFLDKKKYPPITYEYAQEEIAAKCGVKVDSSQGGDMASLQV